MADLVGQRRMGRAPSELGSDLGRLGALIEHLPDRGGALVVSGEAGTGKSASRPAVAEARARLKQSHERGSRRPLLVARATGSRGRVEDLTRRLQETLSSLEAGRPVKATIVGSQILATDGRVDDACAALCSLLDAAPPGHAGWTLPIEPFLAEALQHEAFTAVTTRLADRAR